MLVWIASYPRSGNTFSRIALHRLYGCKSCPDRGGPLRAVDGDPGTLREHWLSTDLTDQEMEDSKETFFAKTHNLPGDDEYPALYLLRDGRDALVSYAWYSLLLHEGRTKDSVTPDDFHTALRNIMLDRRSPYGVWSQHVLAWINRPRTAVIRFEDLIRTPAPCLARAVEQLRLDLPVAPVGAVPEFRELQALKPRFYRRGEVGSWRDEFPKDLLETFWLEHGDGMRAAGYQRDLESAPQSTITAEP